MNLPPGGGPTPRGDDLAPQPDEISRFAERRFASSLATVAEVLGLAAAFSNAAAALLVRFDDAGDGLVLAANRETPGSAFSAGDPAPVRRDADATGCIVAGAHAARSCGMVPVVLATGEVYAHLCVLGADPDPFTAEQGRSLRALAWLLATQLDRDRELGLRERVEAGLRERESRARAMVQHAGDLFLILDAGGVVRYASPAAERLLGWTAAEMVGRLPPEVGLRDPDDRPAYAAALATARAAGPILPTVTARLRRKDGGHRTFVVSRVDRLDDPAVRGILAVAHDVTERVAAEHRLAAERALLSSLMDNAPDALYVTDAALRFRRLNPAAARALGLTDPADAVGRTIAEVAPSPAAAAALAAQASVVASGEPMLNRLEPDATAQDDRWRLTSLVPLRGGDGAVDGLIGLSRDVTEMHRAEAEMAAALVAQRAANAELERLNRVKSDFVAVISHEFRTPLTSIQGFSELIRDVPMPPAEVTECADEVNRAAVRLARMIDRVLDLDRLQRGHERMRFGRVDLNELLAEAVDALRPTTAIHAFRLDLDPALPPLEGDRDQLFQAATNLVGNAVKYAPDGGEIRVATSLRDGVARFLVCDEGVGIPVEALEQVFERYARVGAAGPSIPGTGLGLPITREIVGHHGGRIWAERNLERGVTFHVELSIDRDG